MGGIVRGYASWPFTTASTRAAVNICGVTEAALIEDMADICPEEHCTWFEWTKVV